MPTVDSTNSYVTEAEASAYFDERLYATAWTGADEEDQQKSLLMSRRLLDLHISWKGSPVVEDQALAWPRTGLAGVADDEIPEAVKTAQFELALLLLGTDLTALPATAGFTSIQVDTIKLDVAAGDRNKIIPATVTAILAPFGSLRGEQSSFSVTR